MCLPLHGSRYMCVRVAVVDVARTKVKEYFEVMGHKHQAVETKAKL